MLCPTVRTEWTCCLEKIMVKQWMKDYFSNFEFEISETSRQEGVRLNHKTNYTKTNRTLLHPDVVLFVGDI